MAAFPGSCGKLRLPDKFAEFLGGREPREVTLREAGAGARRRWDVEVGLDGDGHVYLERGWEEFARDHDMGLDNGSSSAETDIDDEPRSQFTVALKKCHLGVRKQQYLSVPPAFQSAHGHEERSKVLPPRVRGKPWPANPNRSLLLVVTIAVLLCAMAAPAAASMGPMVGGWEQITDINATDVQEIARWAVAEHARQANDGLQYKRAVSGMEQVVAGANWKLRVAAVNGDGVECVYVAEVFDQPWTHTRTLESFSPAQSAQPGMCTLPPPNSGGPKIRPSLLMIQGGLNLMACLKDIPLLRGDNYSEWRKKVDLAFVCAEVDWVVDTKQPVKPDDPVRGAAEDSADFEKRKRDHAPLELAYSIDNQKWVNANKKTLAFVKNTIENAIVGSIGECATVGE